MSATMASAPRVPEILRRACAAEWSRMWSVRGTWWCVLAAAVITVGFGVLLGIDAASNAGPREPTPDASQAGKQGLLPGQFALMLLVVLTITSEYATGAITTTLQWTPRRSILLVSRTVVAVAVATAVGLALTLVADLAAWAAAPALVLTASGLAENLGDVAIVVAAGGALAVGAGLATRSTAGGLAVVVLLMFVLPVFLPQFGPAWMESLGRLLPGAAAANLLIDEPAMTTAKVIGVLGGWSVAALTAGGLALLRRDAHR